jgi:hypothetical protein
LDPPLPNIVCIDGIRSAAKHADIDPYQFLSREIGIEIGI